jgi:hypothetical protein
MQSSAEIAALQRSAAAAADHQEAIGFANPQKKCPRQPAGQEDRREIFPTCLNRIKHTKGTKPSGLPVQMPIKFYQVINLKTAKALDITIAPSLLATADGVIE